MFDTLERWEFLDKLSHQQRFKNEFIEDWSIVSYDVIHHAEVYLPTGP